MPKLFLHYIVILYCVRNKGGRNVGSEIVGVGMWGVGLWEWDCGE